MTQRAGRLPPVNPPYRAAYAVSLHAAQPVLVGRAMVLARVWFSGETAFVMIQGPGMHFPVRFAGGMGTETWSFWMDIPADAPPGASQRPGNVMSLTSMREHHFHLSNVERPSVVLSSPAPLSQAACKILSRRWHRSKLQSLAKDLSAKHFNAEL